MKRLNDLNNEAHDGVRGEGLTTQTALACSEVRQEVLVDQPERIT